MEKVEAWLRPPRALYLHIPFCRQKCTYCDFLSFASSRPDIRTAYTAALRREIDTVAAFSRQHWPESEPLRSVYVGGGTPNVMSGQQLASLLSPIKAAWGLRDDAECTLEANPQELSPSFLSACRAAGYNRLSIGLQAVQPHLLDLLGRRHQAQDFAQAVQAGRRAGFTSIGVDIMFGLPGQTKADVAQTLQFVLDQAVDHVSYYGLILEENTPLAIACHDKRYTLPADETEREHYHLIRDRLQTAGLPPYEISSSARPGHACRHNLEYWQALPYYGLGLGAHSFVAGHRQANTSDLQIYLEAFTPQGSERESKPGQKRPFFPVASVQETIDQSEATKEMMLLGLRLSTGVSHADFKARFGCLPRKVFARELVMLAKAHLIFDDGQHIRLTSRGLDLANQAFMAFV